ncbi:MAG: UDP-N-acetylmuramate dehydrogenase [Coriobacteriia bacterium]|nr:UDP-N-acetylmuramate dehydrogenase [Coriobacteriia bacterium]
MSVSAAERRLRASGVGHVRGAEPMARHTTFRIGGPADLFVSCDTFADLSEALRVLDEEGVEWMTVGKGSNLLVDDQGYRGAVVELGREFKMHRVDGTRVKAGAGCILAYVVGDAFSRGLAGMEFAVGVPGTLGGALAMNAGSRDAWIGDVTESVTLYVPGTGLERMPGSDIAWGYRSSGLPDKGVIVEAVLRLERADQEFIRARMEESLSRRKRTQPLGMPSAGSVFKNPEGDSAGRLIEAAGLKGARRGGAMVSDVHANFIVNTGGASAADVLRLMLDMKMTVKDRYGIELTPEVRLIGSFDNA